VSDTGGDRADARAAPRAVRREERRMRAARTRRIEEATARDGARRLSRREQLGVESRRRIVDAAATLMAERGFAGTSIAAVSQRSGLPSGSIYWHFESKEALLAAVMEEGARRWFDALPRVDDLPTYPAQRTAALFEAVDASLESHPEFLRLLLLIALERRDVWPSSNGCGSSRWSASGGCSSSC
jgi:AcrR family transcriptional regulator